ncbi:hypothetical protein M413DRAFT_449443 [Hebeloma cylindrosporum]|uniref:Uncharacterized protein n=1 Tax=Hebeloma cylindrosporum TaxID=76867 RepID=A0A0C3BGX8_HEBCY|nr:hypothetical protein M413DRAFT_449443 [Hebeloma cylindrosporum h7]
MASVGWKLRDAYQFPNPGTLKFSVDFQFRRNCMGKRGTDENTTIPGRFLSRPSGQFALSMEQVPTLNRFVLTRSFDIKREAQYEGRSQVWARKTGERAVFASMTELKWESRTASASKVVIRGTVEAGPCDQE